jgi:hypothetical protein
MNTRLMSFPRWPDLLGMIAALACAVHCAALTTIFTLYPALWLKRRYWEIGLWQKLIWLEWALLGLSLLVLVGAMSLGWRRHRQIWPILLGSSALLVLAILILTPLHFAGPWTRYVAIAAGLLIAGAHFWNLRLVGHAAN